jgi:hypothetical protein
LAPLFEKSFHPDNPTHPARKAGKPVTLLPIVWDKQAGYLPSASQIRLARKGAIRSKAAGAGYAYGYAPGRDAQAVLPAKGKV